MDGNCFGVIRRFLRSGERVHVTVLPALPIIQWLVVQADVVMVIRHVTRHDQGRYMI